MSTIMCTRHVRQSQCPASRSHVSIVRDRKKVVRPTLRELCPSFYESTCAKDVKINSGDAQEGAALTNTKFMESSTARVRISPQSTIQNAFHTSPRKKVATSQRHETTSIIGRQSPMATSLKSGPKRVVTWNDNSVTRIASFLSSSSRPLRNQTIDLERVAADLLKTPNPPPHHKKVHDCSPKEFTWADWEEEEDEETSRYWNDLVNFSDGAVDLNLFVFKQLSGGSL